MIEREYKFLLTEKQFHTALKTAAALYGASKNQEQINYYYDDDSLSLNRRGITARIRQKGGSYGLHLKRHGHSENDYAVSEETEYIADGVPEAITLPEFGRLTYKGQLTTGRHTFMVGPDVSLDMDASIYLGLTDYEAEIEFNVGAREQAQATILALKLDVINRQSKSERFFAALERRTTI